MRELTLDELSIVAGGMQQSSDGGGGVGSDPGDSSPPSSGGENSGGTAPQTVWQKALGTLQAYFNNMEDSLKVHGEYSGSQYDHDMGGDWTDFESFLYDQNGVQYPSHDPAVGSHDYLWSSTDSELTSGSIGGIFGSLAGNTISAAHGRGENEGIFEIGGLMYQTIYHQGQPTTTSGNTVTVSGGHYEVVPIGNPPSGYTPTAGAASFDMHSSLPYITLDASAAANAFAFAHVKNDGTTDADKAWYTRTHDNMAHLYDFTLAHPNSTMTLGSGKIIPLSRVFADMLHTTYVITDTDALTYNPGTGKNEGAVTSGVINQMDPMSHIVYINPQNQKLVDYDTRQPSTGKDYIFFHEFGHALNFQELTGNQNREDNANSAARSLEQLMNIPLIETEILDHQPPNGGYND